VDIVERIRAMTPDDLGERSIVTGTTEQVVEQLRRVAAAGIEEVICYFNFGGYPHEQTLHHMRRFAAEVAPRFAAQPEPAVIAAAAPVAAGR
jgi:alkanesulfonate monooxygenase SsuD/methylene tetrahydromethanopterin reductase-like flavin-dependent oxidoreductase (luciferase family)